MTEFEQKCLSLLERIADAIEATQPKASRGKASQLDLTDTTRGQPRGKYSSEFERFWKDYPRTPTMSKPEAWKQWLKLSSENRVAAQQAIGPYRQYLQSQPTLNAVHACRFLSQERFLGFTGRQALPVHSGMDGRI